MKTSTKFIPIVIVFIISLFLIFGVGNIGHADEAYPPQPSVTTSVATTTTTPVIIDTAPKELPDTGSSSSRALSIAAATLLIGAFGLVLARRWNEQ